MSIEYDEYLKRHYSNVRKSYNWIKRSAPDILKGDFDYSWFIDFHDDTKTIPDEYNAYDEYLFGNKKDKNVENRYRIAKLNHIHSNPHHWQYWILIDEDLGVICTEMPYPYIVEMVCNWWSRSWEEDDLWSIFDYYEKYKNKIKLHKKSRKDLENILDILYKNLERVKGTRKK